LGESLLLVTRLQKKIILSTKNSRKAVDQLCLPRDQWTDKKCGSIQNFLVNSPKGTTFSSTETHADHLSTQPEE